MGAGRSGTTLLDIVIGNHKEAFSVGEVRKFFVFEGKPPSRDKNDNVYVFWREFYAGLSKQLKENKSIEKCAALEYHTSYPLVLFLRLFNWVPKSYCRLWRGFFKSFFDYIGSSKSMVVDSSKYPARAMLLSMVFDDVRLVYLKRNRRDVLKSFSRKGLEQPSKSKASAKAYHIINGWMCGIAYGLHRNHKCVVNYEDLVHSPSDTIASILEELGVDPDPILIDNLIQGGALSTGNVFEGNRIRLNDTLAINK